MEVLKTWKQIKGMSVSNRRSFDTFFKKEISESRFVVSNILNDRFKIGTKNDFLLQEDKNEKS